MAIRLVLLLDDPDPPHPTDDGLGVFRLQLDGKHAPAPGGTTTAAAATTARKPSIAVLPLLNISGDPEQEFFADGLTEDIITELSRFRELLVIARNSTFVYKGRSFKVHDVARELGVDYVLEGSVRKAGDRVRATVQLIDGETDRHIWAERYDRKLEDIFAMQDELTRAVVAILPGRVEADVPEMAGPAQVAAEQSAIDDGARRRTCGTRRGRHRCRGDCRGARDARGAGDAGSREIAVDPRYADRR